MNAEVLDEMLAGLGRCVASLESPQRSNQQWGSYVSERTYDSQEVEDKKYFVSRFIQETKPSLVLDLGCNTGEMAHVALAAGAARVIGYERDGEAANQAYRGALKEKVAFLPLVMDLLNPSPDQGWAQREWPGLAQRAKQADGLLALALVHHLALGSGIPLTQVIAWLVSLAPRGVIEFIPPEDEMAQSLIRRIGERHFAYNREAFVDSLRAQAEIVSTASITASGRTLFAYERNNA
jgi:ribosomal protein L11 methylase PrmA